MSTLTCLELRKIEHRVDEITNVLALTDEDDILGNLQSELEEVLLVLEHSERLALIHESGLRVV